MSPKALRAFEGLFIYIMSSQHSQQSTSSLGIVPGNTHAAARIMAAAQLQVAQEMAIEAGQGSSGFASAGPRQATPRAQMRLGNSPYGPITPRTSRHGSPHPNVTPIVTIALFF